MRTLLLLLLAPLGSFAQSTPYYLADGLNDFSDQMIRQSNPVFITQIGADSMVISTSANAFEYASEYKLNPGETFFRRTRAWGTSMPNFAFLNENGVLLVEEGGSYLLFMIDRSIANSLLEATDKSDVVHLKDSLRTVIAGINNGKRADNARVADARSRKIVTAYIRGFASRRSDPGLVRDIKKWSNNETTTVYIVDANYYITRNYRGEVINKNIPAIIKYHLNGKCFIQWRAFGYEALGGGNFGKDMYTYNKNDTYLMANGAGGSLQLEPGVAYAIDCD